MTRIALMALALLLAGCGTQAGAAPEPTNLTVGLTYIPNVQFAPAYVAEQENFWGDIEVTLRHHGEQEGLFTALVAGKEDVVIAGGDEMLQAVAQGMDLVAVGPYFARSPVEVISHPDAGIADLPDLRGKRIGVPGRYGTNWLGLLAALGQAGLAEGDVEITEIGYTAVAAMSSGKVDAVVGFANNDAVQLRAAGIDVVELPVDDDIVGVAVITTREVLDAHPDAVRDVVDALAAASRRITDDPETALDATAAHVPGLDEPATRRSARATLEATIPLLATDTTQDAAQWRATAALLRTHSIIDADLDVDSLVWSWPRK